MAHSSWTWKLKMISVLAAIAGFGASGIAGLRCYETNDMGNARSKNCSACEYCVLSPEGMQPEDPVRLYGVSAVNEEQSSLDAFTGVFKTSSDLYAVLSMCIFEEYSIPGMELEYHFRCFCKTDNCNKATGLETFLNKLIVNRALKGGMKRFQ